MKHLAPTPKAVLGTVYLDPGVRDVTRRVLRSVGAGGALRTLEDARLSKCAAIRIIMERTATKRAQNTVKTIALLYRTR